MGLEKWTNSQAKMPEDKKSSRAGRKEKQQGMKKRRAGAPENPREAEGTECLIEAKNFFFQNL